MRRRAGGLYRTMMTDETREKGSNMGDGRTVGPSDMHNTGQEGAEETQAGEIGGEWGECVDGEGGGISRRAHRA